MFVCVCNAIREEDLRTAVRQGAPCPRTAYKSLGCQIQCGTCLPCARDVVDEERSRMLSVDARAA
jgi:bacterioferritin-associated ferredoxin